MRRIVFAFLCSCMLVSLGLIATPAKAGDYYYSGGGYYGDAYYGGRYDRPRHRNVWYSSSCCYRKIVRHERSVRYVREDYGYRSSYYDGGYYRRPYRYGYSERPYYRHRYYSSYYDRPHYRHRYHGGYSERPYRSYRYYDAGYSSYDSCYGARVRVADGHGGWVWGRRAGCY